MSQSDAHAASTQAFCTISAKVIRADGTEEDLGVIGTATDQEADAALEALRPIFDAHAAEEADAVEAAHQANEAESRRNEEANQAQIDAARARAAEGEE